MKVKITWANGRSFVAQPGSFCSFTAHHQRVTTLVRDVLSNFRAFLGEILKSYLGVPTLCPVLPARGDHQAVILAIAGVAER